SASTSSSGSWRPSARGGTTTASRSASGRSTGTSKRTSPLTPLPPLPQGARGRTRGTHGLRLTPLPPGGGGVGGEGDVLTHSDPPNLRSVRAGPALRSAVPHAVVGGLPD